MRTRRSDSDSESTTGDVVVPHDPINEQVVLAAAIVDEQTAGTLLKRLTPDHFLDAGHRAAWAGLGELHRRRLEYDPATLQRLVGDKVDVRYLAQIAEMRPAVPDNLDWHIDSLLWDKQRATAVSGPIMALLEAVKNPREAPERVRALARHVADAFVGQGAGAFLHEPAELIRTQVHEIRQRVAGHACYPYGIEGLDAYEDGALDNNGKVLTGHKRILPGAAPGQITVLTGVSGGGKSTTAAALALGLARQRRRVLFASWEMGGGMTLELLACLSLGWSRADLISGRIEAPAIVELEERMHAISKRVRFMKNPFRRNRGERSDRHANERNLDTVQEHLVDSGCDVLIADLWKRCLRDASPEAEEEALYRQQAMVEELRVHAILLQQQRLKDVEQRNDKRPTREGIKGSSAWVEVADTILGVNLPALWKKMPDDHLEMFVLKQRYGRWPLGVEFDWDAEFGSIKGGRSIEYERPGEQQGQGAFEGVFVGPTDKAKGRRGKN